MTFLLTAIAIILWAVIVLGPITSVHTPLLGSRVQTIGRREFISLFYSPIAYVVLFAFLLVMGIMFALFTFVPGRVTEVRMFFDASRFCFFFIIPPLTMSLLADEYRAGRIEMLRTSPLTEIDLLLGKFLGAASFFTILLATSLVYLVLLMIYGRPDYGTVAAAYFGMALLGYFFISIGLFFSSVTQNQIVSFLATLLVLGTLTFITPIAMNYASASISIGKLSIPFRTPLAYIGVGSHIDDFLKGVVESSHVVYFASGTFLFLFLTYLVLESRKWR